MSAAVLLALAARCERGEPSNKLGAAIARACGWKGHPVPDNFVRSLDAAVKLVPKGAWRETNGPRRYLNIPSPVPNYWHTNITVWEPTLKDVHGWAETEALSICAAALRARAAMVPA